MSIVNDSKIIEELINESNKILIVQADNPDGDSLASALALEQILGDLGKDPILYCGIEIPSYLHYLKGWDRVENEISGNFDLTIIVDCSSMSLLDTLVRSNNISKLSKRPTIILDHHDVENTINFTTISCNENAVSTGELIYELARILSWRLNKHAKDLIAISILSDSLGLMTDATTARSISIIAELVESGVKLPELDEARRNLMRKSPELVKYKGELLQRIEYFDNNKISILTIPWEEIQKYSSSYNPAMLALDDMRLVENTQVAVVFKLYKDGKITGKIRCNYGTPIANKLAERFGGGGHKYAAGFKIEGNKQKSIDEIKAECIKVISELLAEESPNETI